MLTPRLGLFLVCLCLPALLPAVTLQPVDEPRQGRRADFILADVPSAENPFNPEEIAVDAEITTPSGRRWTQPAFWHQEFTRRQVAGREEVNPTGPAHWRLRLLPTEAGPHQVSIRIQIKNTSDLTSTASFFAQAGARSPGYVRRSATAPQDFVTDDGRTLRLNGANFCWPDAGGTFTFDRWFDRLQAAEGNFARLWLAPWWLGLEHTPGTLNRYPLGEAWKLDHLFAEAEAKGIYLLLCLDHHGMYQMSNQNWGGSNNFWSTNPYSTDAGGPCATPNDFFTSAEARQTYQKRLRYLIARYSYSPYLHSWQFFNEIDNTFIQQVRGEDVLAWHQVMARWLRAADPMKHLISTSMTGGADQPDFWKLPELDYSVYHSYQDPAPARKLAGLAADFVQRYGKPMLVGEFGVDARTWNIAIDPHLRGFRQSLWGAVMGGSAGPAHSWWWEDLEKDDAYFPFRSLVTLLRESGWEQGAWAPTAVEQNLIAPTNLLPAPAGAATFATTVTLNPGRRLPLRGSVALPHALAAERASEYVSAFLYGTRNPQLPSKQTFRAHFADKARLVFRVNSVASDNQLLVRVGDQELLRTGFTDKDGRALMNREIDREYTVELPAGLHTVELSNLGYDWTGLESLRFEGLLETGFSDGWQFGTEAFALRSGAKGVVYAVAPQAVYPAGALRYRLPEVTGQTIVLSSWPQGDYSVRWFDPESGRPLRERETVRGGERLILSAPPFRVDAVALIESHRRP